MITIVLAEDQHLVREGVKLLLESESDFDLVAEASDGLEAVQLSEEKEPDVLLLDLMVPRLHGLEVIRQVRKSVPATKVIILTVHSEGPYVKEALHNGASGYVLKNVKARELAKAIRDVHAGKNYFSQEIEDVALSGNLENRLDEAEDIYGSLTTREREILLLSAEGENTARIAAQLFISPRTAETHRSNLMRKLSLKSQTDLVKFAIRRGIVQP